MTTNLRLKNPTCRTYIFKRLLSYFFNQINNFIMVLIETVDQKNKNPRLRDLAAKNSRIRDAKKHKKTRFRDSFKTPLRFRDWNKNFRDPEFSGYHSPPLVLLLSKAQRPPKRQFSGKQINFRNPLFICISTHGSQAKYTPQEVTYTAIFFFEMFW